MVKSQTILNRVDTCFWRVIFLGLFIVILSGCSLLQSSKIAETRSASFNPAGYDYLHRMRAAVPVEPLPPLRLERTPEVLEELRALTRSRHYIERSLVRRQPYLELFTQIFRDEGVPVELINVAIVESACNPDARSKSGAVGLWQFMRTTAQKYDLVISKKRDDRTDVILSTIAAARHFRDLYLEFSDWPLALAAYNAGVGGVRRALVRAGADDFWTVARKKKLTKQTIRYVPRILAVSIIASDLDGHGFSNIRQRLELLNVEPPENSAASIRHEMPPVQAHRKLLLIGGKSDDQA